MSDLPRGYDLWKLGPPDGCLSCEEHGRDHDTEHKDAPEPDWDSLRESREDAKREREMNDYAMDPRD